MCDLILVTLLEMRPLYSQPSRKNATHSAAHIGDIGDSGASSLSQALATNSSLTSLDLRVNSIGVSGATSLSQASAANPSLTILYVWDED